MNVGGPGGTRKSPAGKWFSRGNSESVVLHVEVGDDVLVLLCRPLDELVLVIGERGELLVDVLEGLERLGGESELLGFVALKEDLDCLGSGGLGPEVEVVTVLGDCLSDLICVVLCEDICLGSSVPVRVHVHVPEGLLLLELDRGVHE